MTIFGQRDGYTYDHSLQLQFIVALLFADLPSLSPSFHTCSTRLRANLEAPKMLIREYMMYTCALAQTAPLLSKPRDKQWRIFDECWPLVALYLGVLRSTKILLVKRHIA